jgi:hypothetical protein
MFISKHTKKNCAPSWPYLQEYTRMHGQQNIKKSKLIHNLNGTTAFGQKHKDRTLFQPHSGTCGISVGQNING